MLPNPDSDSNALLQEVLTELTADGTTNVSWQAIQALLGEKMAALGGDPKKAGPYVQKVHDLEQEN